MGASLSTLRIHASTALSSSWEGFAVTAKHSFPNNVVDPASASSWKTSDVIPIFKARSLKDASESREAAAICTS